MTISEKDLDRIKGRFIIKVTANAETIEGMSDEHLAYQLEKKIGYVGTFRGDKDGENCLLYGIFHPTDGHTITARTGKEFVDFFNNPSLSESFRLLYGSELRRLFSYMEKTNY